MGGDGVVNVAVEMVEMVVLVGSRGSTRVVVVFII